MDRYIDPWLVELATNQARILIAFGPMLGTLVDLSRDMGLKIPKQIKTLMARLDSGTTVDAGGLRRNPTSVYVDPDREVARQATEGDPRVTPVGGFLRRWSLGAGIVLTAISSCYFYLRLVAT